MSKYDFWATTVVAVVIGLLLSVVAITIGIGQISKEITGILEAPAATSNVTIETLMIVTEDAEITLHNFSGQVNSKVLDLIILSAGR